MFPHEMRWRLTLQSNYFNDHENLENTAIPTRNTDIFQDEIAQISKLGLLKIMLLIIALYKASECKEYFKQS